MPLPGTPEFEAQVLDRDNYECKVDRCPYITATGIAMIRTTDELTSLKRDPNNSDNWQAVCSHHGGP